MLVTDISQRRKYDNDNVAEVGVQTKDMEMLVWSTVIGGTERRNRSSTTKIHGSRAASRNYVDSILPSRLETVVRNAL